MKLIVGLGNPGSQYERTRHNVGFMAIDLFAQKYGAMNFRVAHESFLADVLLNGEKLLLVVVDDVALPAGAIRLRASGSAGGHNGLRDIERAVGGLNYSRLRIGVDPPGVVPQKDYVLAAFTSEQKPRIESAIKASVEAIGLWARDGIVKAMNKFNPPPAAAEPS